MMILSKVGQFFFGNEILPSCDSYIIAGCERDLEEAKKQLFPYDATGECLMRLIWALVHSNCQGEVKRGIKMIQSLPLTGDPLQKRDMTYLLAVGYYKTREYSKCMDHVKKCLQITPDWRLALILETAVKEKNKKGDVFGFAVSAFFIVMTVRSIAEGMSRKE